MDLDISSSSETIAGTRTEIAEIEEQYENKKSLRRNFLSPPCIFSLAHLHRGKGNVVEKMNEHEETPCY